MSKSLQKSTKSLSSQAELRDKLFKYMVNKYSKEYAADHQNRIDKLEVGKAYHDFENDILIYDGLTHEKSYYYLNFRSWDIKEQCWGKPFTESYEHTQYIKFPALAKHPLELFKEAQTALDSGDVEPYRLEITDDQAEMRQSTEVLHFGSKESLLAVKSELEARQNHAIAIRRTMDSIIETKKRELERVKDRLYGLVADFKKKIDKIEKVIITIELYIGVNEEIKQLKQGVTAAADYPVCIRQGLLYMDEELGDPMYDKQGLEFKDIADWDKWVVKKDNYKKLFPEEKGICALQVRRNHKDRNDMHIFTKMAHERQDNYTYLLIRNGDNVYRLLTDKISFRPRLFPKRNELQRLFEMWQYMDKKEKADGGEEQHLWSDDKKNFDDMDYGSNTTEAKEYAENHVFFYKMRFALFQGILERTEIFLPSKEPIQLFAKDGQDAISKGLVRLIYDDELTLPSGKLAFWDWVKSINKQIDYGSRVILANSFSFANLDTKRDGNRLDDRYHEGRYSNLKGPKAGLYYVQKGLRWTSQPVWVTNPKFDESLPVTPDRSCFHPDDKNTSRDTGLLMTVEEQRKYGLKVTTGLPFGGDDYDRKNVKVNPRMAHEFNKDKRYEYEDVKENFMCIRYNPKDLIEREGWGYKDDPEERKNSISWKIYRDDDFILNYDLVTIPDIEFYLKSRVDRRHYVRMMPLLSSMRDSILQEQKLEQDFKRLVQGELLKLGVNVTELEITIACEDWKKNLKWKRAIAHDDQKALRMIIKKLRSL